MQGWVKLHRQIMKSDTFSKLNAIQQIITIYIILNANHDDGVWYDKYKDIELPIKRGQLVTSRNKIANEWFKGDKEITEQKVRTTLDRLERYGFLTKQSTNGYTLLNIVNYGVYQSNENESNQVYNQDLTRHQPGTNQALTTNKNVKNDKNEKKKDYISKIRDLSSHFSSIENFDDLGKEYWNVIRETRKSGKIAESVIYNAMNNWTNYDPEIVEYALKKHISDHRGMREEYTLGIMRNTKKSDINYKNNKNPMYRQQTGKVARF